AIAERHDELRRILRAATMRKLMGELHGEQLTRTPKGFATDHPAAGLLKFKRFILYVELPPQLATTPKMYAEVLHSFNAMRPFMAFLAAATKPRSKAVREADFLVSRPYNSFALSCSTMCANCDARSRVISPSRIIPVRAIASACRPLRAAIQPVSSQPSS